MRKINFLFAAIITGILSVSLANAQSLSGTYIVGTGGDFTTITAAVDSMISRGIAGNIVFNIKDGIYNENINFDDTVKNADKYSITFQSQSNDSAKVAIVYAGTCVAFDYNPLNLIFKNLTIATSLNVNLMNFQLVENATSKLEIIACHLVTPINAPTMIYLYGSENKITKLNIEKSKLQGGTNYNLYANVYDNDGTYNESIENVSVKNSSLSNGVYLEAMTKVKNVAFDNVTGNKAFQNYGLGINANYDSIVNVTINKSNFTSNSMGLYLYSNKAVKNIEVDSSQINAISSYGIYAQLFNEVVLSDVKINKSKISALYYAVYLYCGSNDIKNLVMTGDTFKITQNYYWTTYIQSSGTLSGLLMDKCFVDANTIYKYGAYFYANSFENNTIKNSKIISYYESLTIGGDFIKGLVLDNDSITSTNGSAVNISANRTLTNLLVKNAYSKAFYDAFYFGSDLLTDSVTVDKSTFECVNNYNGLYGYSDKDIRNITVTGVKTKGGANIYMYGNVTVNNILFDRDTLITNQNITMIDIEGYLGDFSDVKISNSKIQTNGGAGIYLYNDGDIKNVTIINDSVINRGGNWGYGIEMETDYGFVNAEIRNNNILCDAGNGYGIYSYYAGNIIIDNNKIEAVNSGSFDEAIYLQGIDQIEYNKKGNITITNNKIFDFSNEGMYIEYLNGNTKISNNEIINNSGNGAYGIYPYYVNGNLEISNNVIQLDTNNASDGAIYFDYTQPDKGLVYNNLISGFYYYGLYIYQSKNIDFINNTFNLNLWDSSYAAVYFDDVNAINNSFVNNIFSQYGNEEGRWYEMYEKVNLDKNVWTNNIYNRKKDSVSFVYLNYGAGVYVDSLSQWQKSYKKDSLSSIKKVPFINDTTNLHIACGTSGLDKSIANAAIKFDIDGQPRAAKATLGADEIIASGSTIAYADRMICSNNPVMLDAGYFTGSTYAWTGSKTGQKISVNAPGAYTVTITGSCGTITGTINVKAVQPVADFTTVTTYTAVEFTNTSKDAVSYLWSFGDGGTSTLENPVHVYKTIGVYNATLTAYAECDTTTKTTVMDFNYIGMDEIIEGVSVYPNPAVSNVNIAFASPVDATVQVISLDGAQLASKNLEASAEVNIDISSFTSGMYLIKVTAAEKTIIRKLVKE